MNRQWCASAALAMGLWLQASVAPQAAECSNPHALGVSRTIAVDPAEHPLVGSFQYGETLPLAEKEIVLTFDDAPRPTHTAKVLDILAAECVKATYFVIGRHAAEFPDLVRRIAAGGHTICTHSNRHPLIFDRAATERIAREVEDGIAAVTAALGEDRRPAPFFRIPGLLRSERADNYLRSKGLMVWSTDVMAHDWKRRIDEAGIIRRTFDRLAAKGNRGIVLLHDIKEKTASALPDMLREFKARGFRIVHVVAASQAVPKTPTEAQDWVLRSPASPVLPTILMSDLRNLNVTLREQIGMSAVDFCGMPASAGSRRLAGIARHAGARHKGGPRKVSKRAAYAHVEPRT